MLEKAELENERLWRAGRVFGELHWRILKGYEELLSRVHGKETSYGFETTDFGEQVGGDEIHWWVFHSDPDVAFLRAETERALESAQTLKQEAVGLKAKSRGMRSYGQLIDVLVGFAESSGAEIRSLTDYVRWLESRAPFGPTLLFTYRVWGTTRRGERYFPVTAGSVERDPQSVDAATEIVFGVRSRRRPVIETEYFDLLEKYASSSDPEYTGVATVPEIEVVERTSIAVMDLFAEYWGCVRDSLRNIVLDCESYLAERDLLNSQSFWRRFIEKVIQDRSVERPTWDLTESLSHWHAKGAAKQDLEVRFCEQVASFANAQGGALIIGVSDRNPRRVQGVDNLEDKVQAADQSIRKYTTLKSADFRFVHVPFIPEGNTCLVIAVAKTKDVVEVHDERGSHTYPIRRQTGLDRTNREDVQRGKHDLAENDWGFVAEFNRFLADR